MIILAPPLEPLPLDFMFTRIFLNPFPKSSANFNSFSILLVICSKSVFNEGYFFSKRLNAFLKSASKIYNSLKKDFTDCVL